MARKRGGTDVLALRSQGYARLIRDASETERTASLEVRRAMERAAPSIESAYRRFAPVESGRMADSIYSKLYTAPGGAVQLRVAIGESKDPVTGYDYLEQSRFGRPEIISTGRRMVLSLGRSKSGVPSSRYPAGPEDVPPGVPFGFRRVAGFTPERDWVTAGERNARRQATRIQQETAQGIGRRGLLRSFG